MSSDLKSSSGNSLDSDLFSLLATQRTGRAFTSMFGSAADWMEGLCTAVDAQGRYYLAGTVDFGTFVPASGFTSSAKFEWYVMRFTTSLTLDHTWGAGGVVTLNFGNHDMELTSIVIQADGKIVCGGIDYNVTPTKNYRVARFNTDGTLDASFGAYGVTTLTPVQPYYSPICLVALQSTGNIIVAATDNRDESHRYVRVWRLFQNGNRDLVTWGSSGAATYQYNSTSNDTVPQCLLVDSSNKVYVGGYVDSSAAGSAHKYAYIARFTAAGLADSTWGADTGLGQYAVTLDGPQAKACTVNALLLESGGKIVAAGSANSDASHTGIIVARFTTAGVLDTTFGVSSGYTLHNFGILANDDGAWASFDSNGKILVAGQTTDASGNYYTPVTRFSVYRFTALGAVDSTYGTSGALSPAPAGDNRNDSVFYGVGSYAVRNADDTLLLPGHVNSDTGVSVGCAVALKSDGSVNTALGDPVSAAAVTAPTVTTSAATAVGTTSATLNGSVTGQAGGTTYYQFEYGLTAGLYPYRAPNPASATISDGTPQSVSAALTGLLSGYTYHFRLVAITYVGDATAIAYGADATVATTSGATNTLLSDTFTDANGTLLAAHTPDVNLTGGGFWTDRSGSGSINGNKVVGTGDYFATITTGVLDCSVQADFVWSGTGGKQLTLFVRYQDSSNYWQIYADGTNFRIVERIGGGSTTRATAAQSIVASTTYTIRVVVAGTTITATINGGNSISYGSMSTLTTFKNAGFELFASGVTLDNFVVTA